MVNNIAVIRILGDEFGYGLVDKLVSQSKIYLGWDDFVADFSKHTNSTLLTDLFEKTRQWNLKQMQIQDANVSDPHNKTYISSLLQDAKLLFEQKESIKNQLSTLIDLIELRLSKNSSQ